MTASRLSEVVDNVDLFRVALKERRQGVVRLEIGHGYLKGAEIRSSLHIPYGGS